MEYKLGKYKYFDFLVLINNHYFNLIPGENVRECDENELFLYNEMLGNFFKKLIQIDDLNEIIRLILNLTGFLLYRQPFFDGNSRTLKTFIELLFKELKYMIDLTPIEDTSLIIPLFYYDNETCDNDDVINIKRRLTKFE